MVVNGAGESPLGIVEVKEGHPLQADHFVEFAYHAGGVLVDRVTRRERVAGVEANA